MIYPRKEHGVVIITDAHGETLAPTLQCSHCGIHWQVVPGSGRVRGYCQLCNQVTCGSTKCMEHIPFEKKLEMVEQGKMRLEDL